MAEDSMTFFRTKDNRRDPKPREDARKRRRQQLQAQQQLLDNQTGGMLNSRSLASRNEGQPPPLWNHDERQREG
jgi:hypothetical protein